ncbi:MAG: LacI family DNA-binding transcriptional regulator [Lentisphaeria bacterium]|nr:LacI family DNA-binding transcriptional regulator [Lentisphaeria bacterium]MBR7120150.1 LacI family DNA-binding transcriptional regulator [Lentisphaeria bacterium]
MATLKDIAEKTGLSINTVSRAIRGSGYVSEKAAELVSEAVRELGYHPNFAARNLRLKSSREIFVVAESYDHLHIERIAGACNYIENNNYKATVRFIRSDVSPVEAIKPDILKYSPAGVIFIASDDRLVDEVAGLRSKIPCVIASLFPLGNCDNVCVDRYSGVYNAVQYLYRQGRRRIAFGETSGAANRKEGYLRAVRDLKLPELIFRAVSSDHGTIRRDGIKIAKEISGMREMPDAIQTSDYLACGLLSGFLRLGIRVPEDIAVIGFDDREIAEMTDPPLTTLSHPGEELGAACAKMLIDRIESGFCSDALPQSVKIPMKLVIRQST